MGIDREKYKTVVVYGIGRYYESIKKDLFQKIRPDYLCDRKWEEGTQDNYDGIPILKQADILNLDKVLVIIAVAVGKIAESLLVEFKKKGIEVVYVNDVLDRQKIVTGKMLKETYSEGIYEDSWGNRIYFNQTLSDFVTVEFCGKNNILSIGNEVAVVSYLRIRFGNDGICNIGEKTEIIGINLSVSKAKLLIGKDCLLSSEVLIQTNDGHHIFDKNTHRRINWSKDVVIGDNVWVGFRTTLLAGTQIGQGSIVGAGAVTSSQFGSHLVIAGSPARVIREDICWSQDNTEYFDRESLDECIRQEAMKYL